MLNLKIDFRFDSESDNGKSFQLKNEGIIETGILFEREKCVVMIAGRGTVDFYCDDMRVAMGRLPEINGGMGNYDTVICAVNGDEIKLSFPIYQWIDTYPNCDGEYDRWITREIGCEKMAFNLVTFEIK